MKRRKLMQLPKPGRTFNKPQSGGRAGGRAKSGGRPGMSRRFDLGTPIKYEHVQKIFDNWEDIQNFIKDPEDGADKLYLLVKNKLKEKLNTKQVTGIGITHNPSEHTSSDDPIAPAIVMNSSRKTVLSNMSDDRLHHKTKYITGRKPTSGVLSAKKLYGSGYRVLADSMVDVTSVSDRNILTGECGFNQKLYHIPPIKSQVPTTMIKDLIGNDQLSQNEQTQVRRALSNVLNIKQQFMIKNSSANSPMVFTIHLVKIKNNDYAPVSLNSMFVRMFYDSDDWASGGDIDYTATRTGFIPKYLQHTPLETVGTTSMQACSVLVSNKLKSLTASSSFRAGCDIVESFSKTIAPGDYWNFSHIHRCGSGIDFESVFRSTNAGSEDPSIADNVTDQQYQPFTYAVIFEARGKTCEAYEIPELNAINTYLGTSPVFFSYEFKTSAYFAASISDLNNVNTPSYRVFEQDTLIRDFSNTNETREKFILPASLSTFALSPAEAASVGKAFIPYMTSTVTSTRTHEGQQVPG